MNTSAKPSCRPDTFRWTILFMLFAATTINYLDRQIIAILKPVLDQELGWTDVEYGVIMSVFQASYAVGLTIFGWIVDRYGSRVGYVISIVWWSLGAISHIFAMGVKSMGACRVLLGLGEGGNFPASVKTVTNWFPAHERVLATTLFNSGANVGALAAPALIPAIALACGWRAAFLAAGSLGFIWAVFWLFMPRGPRVRWKGAVKTEDAGKAHEAPALSWGRLLRYRATWSLILVRFLTDPIWWFFLFWLPDFFNKHFNFDIKESMVPLVTIYAIVTVLSILGGALTKLMAGLGWELNRVRKVSMLIFAACVLPVAFVQSMGMWPIVCVIGLAGAAHQAWSASVYTLGADMFPKSSVASVTGLSSMAGQIGSVLFQTAVGFTLAYFARHGHASAGFDVIFIVCGCAYLAAFFLLHLMVPRIRMLSPEDD
ncbi:MAG: MFS transporter [Akkermansiaceae bacterium]|nr:MFS transporter [Akkermansiaceae bacterium]